MIQKILLKLFSLAGLMLFAANSSAQLYIDNATFTIQSGATVTVQGDVTSNVDIQGPGKLLLKGSANQNVNMNGFSIPNLEMDNTANATLTGNVKFSTTVLFTNGKILLGTNTATLLAGVNPSGMGASKFFETNSTGYLRREVTGDISGSVMPVGTGTDYTPVSITNTGSTYSTASIGVQAKGVADANKHPRTESFLTVYWPISKTGITGGTSSAVGTYVDPTRVTGTETDLRGIFWNGTNWSLAGGNQDAALNTAGATVTTASGELYAMNKFILANFKAYLQGSYNTVTAKMNDLLRNSGAYSVGVYPASNLIPTADPYRTGTYTPSFAHVANTTAEATTTTVLSDQANPDKNVVDWVFLELRDNAGPPTVVQQTRSALILRDGSIVDVDGTSPVYFKNVDAATYNVAIRHRNHLGIRTASVQSLSLTAPSVTDLTTNAANLFSSYVATLTAGVFGLYSSNANDDAIVKMTGLNFNSNDYLKLINVLGSSINQLPNVYSKQDLNMDRTVKMTGLNASNNDYLKLINTLGSSINTLTQPTY